jgi:hypothetical protein
MKSITIRLWDCQAYFVTKRPYIGGFVTKYGSHWKQSNLGEQIANTINCPRGITEDTRIDRFDPDHLAVTRFAREHGNHQLLSPFSTVTCSVVFIPAAAILSRARRFTSM